MIQSIQNTIYNKLGIRTSKSVIVVVPLLVVLSLVLLVQLSTRTKVENLSPQEEILHNKQIKDDMQKLDLER